MPVLGGRRHGDGRAPARVAGSSARSPPPTSRTRSQTQTRGRDRPPPDRARRAAQGARPGRAGGTPPPRRHRDGDGRGDRRVRTHPRGRCPQVRPHVPPHDLRAGTRARAPSTFVAHPTATIPMTVDTPTRCPQESHRVVPLPTHRVEVSACDVAGRGSSVGPIDSTAARGHPVAQSLDGERRRAHAWPRNAGSRRTTSRPRSRCSGR